MVTNGHNGRPDADAVQANFHQHRGTWNEWQAKRKVLDKIENDLKAALKADGFFVKEFEVADALAGPAKKALKVRAEVELRLRVAKWMGHPMSNQFDLFAQPPRATSVDEAYAHGVRDCQEGKIAGASYPPDSENGQAYLAGYHDETARRVREGIQKTEADEGDAGARTACGNDDASASEAEHGHVDGVEDDGPAAGFGASRLPPAAQAEDEL